MEKFIVELVTPEKLFYSGKADMVVIPGSEGDFGVLPGHSPLISLVRDGVVSISNGEKHKQVSVSGGFAEVTGERCTIIAEVAKEL